MNHIDSINALDATHLDVRDALADSLLTLMSSQLPNEPIDPEMIMDIATDIVSGPRNRIKAVITFLRLVAEFE